MTFTEWLDSIEMSDFALLFFGTCALLAIGFFTTWFIMGLYKYFYQLFRDSHEEAMQHEASKVHVKLLEEEIRQLREKMDEINQLSSSES